jgi:hypothetical protein
MAPVDEIKGKLRRVRTASITTGVLSAVFLSFLVVGASWLLVSALDIGLGLPNSLLKVIAVFLLVSALAALAYVLFQVFAVSHSIRMYAARVGGELEEIGLGLLTVLDLSGADRERLGYSRVLIDRSIAGIAERVHGLDFQVRARRRNAFIFFACLVVIAITGVAWQQMDASSFSYSLKRLGFFWGVSDESGVSIEVRPGDSEILAGSRLDIEAEVTGFIRKSPVLHVLSGGEETAFKMEKSVALEGGGSPGRRGHGVFISALPRVDRDIGYFITAGDEATRTYRITVNEEPRIKNGSITLSYPAHTGLGRQVLPRGVWDITAPYGTDALIEVVANCDPESIWVETADSTRAISRVMIPAAGDSTAVTMRLAGSFTYSIEMITREGHRANSHGPHSVTVVKDQPPYVRIESPGDEIMLEADMIIPLSVVALDDYGIGWMTLHYAAPGDTSQVRLSFNGRTQARSDYNWDTGFLDVLPGDVITYYVSVADNDALTGPKYARTEVHVARIPSLYDLYEEIEDEQDEAVENLEEIAEEARQLKEQLEEAIEDMKRTGDVGWEEQQSIKQNLAEREDLRKRVEDVAQALDETLEKMGENELVDFEVIAKMEEVRKLFEEVATEEMIEQMRQMQEAMSDLSPEEMRAAMEDMNMSQEELLQKLDRAIEMLKRLQMQQKMEAVANLAETIAEEQKRLNEEVGEGCDLENAAEKQRSLGEDTEKLKEMMEDLAELLKEGENPLGEDIEKASEFMESEQIAGMMAQAQAAMSKGEASKAGEKGEQAEKDMSEVADMLGKARDTMMGKEQQEVMEALTKAMHDLRDISGKHEEVLHQIKQPGGISSTELARMEMVYKEALDRVAMDLLETSRKSLLVSPMLGMAVLEIGSKLQTTSDLLAQGIRGRAEGDVRSALGQMNTLITGLMDAMDQASSCSSSGGMCSAFQNLESMCSSQMGINKGTQSVLSMGEDGMSMEARAQMGKLAAQQEAVRKGLDDLSKELGNRGEILGRLGDLAEEARQVAQELRSQNIGPETVRRQEQILTRMLNAQRSMRRRDYSERRKSRAGELYEVEPPPELSEEERAELMQDLLYQRRGYYPPEYEELIRAYFKAISTTRAGE